VRRINLPERNAMAPKTCTPAYYGAFLARSWAEGTTKVRHLFSDIRHRGRDDQSASDEEAPAAPRVRTLETPPTPP
jgi:hypothetical protein